MQLVVEEDGDGIGLANGQVGTGEAAYRLAAHQSSHSSLMR